MRTDRDTSGTIDEALTSLLDSSGGTASRALPTTTAGSKGTTGYQVHTYPTKVPPAAIEPFILASTEPGGTVLDPFCGSGMTGLAAQNTGRRAVLSDLSPGAVHLAHNHTHPVDGPTLVLAMKAMAETLTALESSLYRSTCPTCGKNGVLRHMVWTDVHPCRACGDNIRVWDETDEAGSSSRVLTCTCGHTLSRAGVKGVVSEPAEKAVDCTACRKLQRGDVHADDLALLVEISGRNLSHWLPSVPMGPDREMYRRSALHLRNITNVSDFWNTRSKLALSAIWDYIKTKTTEPVASALRFAFTNTAWHATKMRRYNAYGGQRPLTGTLYIPQLIAEGNVFEIFRHQVAQLKRFYGVHPALGRAELQVLARRSSATNLSWLPDGCMDYVFTDPPFGANLFYGDCNIVWEAWLGDVTNLEKEIVVNRSLPANAGGKTLDDYEQLLGVAFSEIRRVMAPSARASVVFHNADDRVWSALLAATNHAGLAQTEVSVLDKVQRSQKGYKGRSGAELVPFYDLVITFMSGTVAPKSHINGAGAIALDAVTNHLKTLPSLANDQTQQQRSLEYLYSLSVGTLISTGHELKGLSFRSLEQLLRENFTAEGRHFFLA